MFWSSCVRSCPARRQCTDQAAEVRQAAVSFELVACMQLLLAALNGWGGQSCSPQSGGLAMTETESVLLYVTIHNRRTLLVDVLDRPPKHCKPSSTGLQLKQLDPVPVGSMDVRVFLQECQLAACGRNARGHSSNVSMLVTKLSVAGHAPCRQHGHPAVPLPYTVFTGLPVALSACHTAT